MDRALLYLQKTLDTTTLKHSIGLPACADLCKCVSRIKPEKNGNLSILEIGTHNAVSTVALSDLGVVHTIDIMNCKYTEEIVSQSPRANRILRFVGNDQSRLRSVVARGLVVVHVAFIDAVHDSPHIYIDFEFASRFTRHIIFHDYSAHKFPGVYTAINEIAAERKAELQELGNTLVYMKLPAPPPTKFHRELGKAMTQI